MVDKHSHSFFGKSTGLTLQSSSRTEPFIFLKCIQKKNDGNWEKPSQGEGKTIKLSLDEIVMILEVLNRNLESWSSFHSFNDVKTQISFQWEDQTKKKLKLYVDKYSKMLNFAQSEIFRRILEHILGEKIVYATTLNKSENYTSSNKEKPLKKKVNKTQSNAIPFVKESIEYIDNAQSEITGNIEGETDKALLIKFNNNQQVWIPKSGIHSDYRSNESNDQLFLIDNWILKKNSLVPM